MGADRHLISVIVVTFNEGGHVARLKQALDRLGRPPGVSVECVLVDGGSGDDTVDLARRGGFDRIVELPGANIPRCRNAGVKASGGDWIAFIDADCEPAEDWLHEAAFFLGRGEACVLGWPVEPPMPRTWVQDAWHLHWMSKNLSTIEHHGKPVIRDEAFRLITTRNLAMHRLVFDRVAGFDEDLATGEDTDFVFRAYLAKVDVLAVPSLHVVHHGEPATLGEFYRQQLWHANRSSYVRIARRTGMRTGGRAPLFTLLFAGSLALFVAALVAALATGAAGYLLGMLPFLAVVTAPAARTAFRGGRPGSVPALAALYAAYGLARSLDLLGFNRGKQSWKSPGGRAG